MALLEWLRKSQLSPSTLTAVEPSPPPAVLDRCSRQTSEATNSAESSDTASAVPRSNGMHRVLPPEPHQPKLNFPKRSFGKQQRGFSATWYQHYPWLHYLQEEDSVLCFYCASAVQQKMPIAGHTENKPLQKSASITWQKALQKFSKHERSACHRHAGDLILSKTGDVADMLSTAHAKEIADNRRALCTILSTLCFLARQGLPLRGNYVSDDGSESSSNFMQLLQLRTEDVRVLATWLQKSQDRFTSPMIQNELLEIMPMTVLRKIAGKIAGKQFSIMVDETTDVSNTEELVFCLRYVNDQLITHEEFLGLHSLDSTTAQSTTHTIEDILLRLSLQLENCRGQCYYGASAMAGSRTGVATIIRAKEPQALYTHSNGHALNLAVQDNKHCKNLTMLFNFTPPFSFSISLGRLVCRTRNCVAKRSWLKSFPYSLSTSSNSLKFTSALQSIASSLQSPVTILIKPQLDCLHDMAYYLIVCMPVQAFYRGSHLISPWSFSLSW